LVNIPTKKDKKATSSSRKSKDEVIDGKILFSKFEYLIYILFYFRSYG